MTRAIPFVLALVVPIAGVVQPLAGQLPAKKYLTKDGTAKAGSFAAGLMVGKTAYVSGKGDYSPNAAFQDKVKNCLNEVRKTLQVGGLDMRHVVQSWVYLEDTAKFDEFNKIYGEVFKDDPPVRTTVGVSRVPGESHLEITCVAYSDLAERRRIGDLVSGAPYSPAIKAGDTLYLSGKGDHLPGGGHPATFEEQVRQTMRNVEATLKQAGLDFRHVVMSYVFLDKVENLALADKVYKEFFKAGAEPACATVFVDWIPGGSHVEVTVTATTDLAKRKVVRPADMKDGRIPAGVTGSAAVWAGDTLYLSALPGFKYQERVLATGLADQVSQMGHNHAEVLQAAGLKLEDIVSGHVYLRDIQDYNALNKVYAPIYSKGPGVRTCLMPYSGKENNEVRVLASFIAARTAAKMPAIKDPVMFDTPEADAICSALEVFPPDNPWNLVVEDWPVHPNSRNIVASMGVDKPLRYDPDMSFILVPPNQKKVNVKITLYPEESDKGPFPVPDNCPIEGWPVFFQRAPKFKGLTLEDVQRDKLNLQGDRHAIVVDPVNRLLYEFFGTYKTDAGWKAGQASFFDLKSNKLRPDGWTSADAAGLPIFPAVVRYDELQRGLVEHAMRVTAEKTRKAYVHPATHYASPHTDVNLPRMGERFRLRKDFDIRGFSPQVQAILKGLKKYGMLMADNGNDWAISASADPRIPELHDELRKVKGADFEVIMPPPGYQPAQPGDTPP